MMIMRWRRKRRRKETLLLLWGKRCTQLFRFSGRFHSSFSYRLAGDKIEVGK